ncbi:hypothetical protein EGJ27_01295 [Pseudomonas sp. v388]|uniref:hypothetical protein n=1 Tax=Pseudomonas sp. v388 TaxID=2479849 RepID=UPI000F7878B1|nr:hypothetical protein [Pseudomonas sp. v388]RRV10290.1 hypothetical protein EGJ27_01295 [Pseudomonas sp. v388]
MFSKMTKVLILTGLLIASGAASANDRNVIVPVIAGAAVGAVLATVIASKGNDRDHRHERPRYHRAYAPAPPRMQYRRYAPPPRHHYDNRRYDRGHDSYRGGRRW